MIKRLMMLVAASAAISAAVAPRFASGQAPGDVPEPESCKGSVIPGAYHRCALLFEGNKVRRGSDGVVVAGQGLFGPPHLTELVAGDSAMRYARLFERRSKQSMALVVIGAVVMMGSTAAAECGGSYSGCAYDWGLKSTGFNVLLGGAVLTGVGINLQLRATRAGMKAVWWHNERFAR